MQAVQHLASKAGAARQRHPKLVRTITHPVVYLFSLAFIAYGVLLPALGLYGDDWEFLYGFYRYGSSGFEGVVGWMRPYSVFIYNILTSLFGGNVLAYHIYVLVTRWVTAVLVWQILALLFPQHPRPVLWTASLFLIYPAFYQQTLPLSFSLHFTVQVCFLLSILLMLLSTQAKTGMKILLNILGACLALSIFVIEYFAGLEFFRPVLLWMKFGQDGLSGWKRIQRVLLFWIPYLLIQGSYYAWRIFFFKSGYQDPVLFDLFKVDPAKAFQELTATAREYLLRITFTAWGSVFDLTGGFSGIIQAAIILLAAVGIYAYFRYTFRYPEDQDAPRGLLFMGLGLFAMLVSGIPVWSTLLEYRLDFPFNRLSLPFLLGSSLFWVGLILVLVKERHQLVIFTLMISLSAGAHFLNANAFRRKAVELNKYFWQLTWRMPGLKPGTFLLSQKLPLGYYSDNNLTPLLLWTYAPEDRAGTDPYRFLDIEIREGTVIPELSLGAKVEHADFKSTAGNAIVIFSTPTSCIHVLTERDPLDGVPDQLARAAVLTNLDQIITQPAQTARPPDQLGPEPAHDWCYYYSKADLARQEQNWQRIADLGDEAFRKGFGPTTPVELIPFIDGYAHNHQLERALQISELASETNWMIPPLCRTWAEIKVRMDDQPTRQRIEEFTTRLNCVVIPATQ